MRPFRVISLVACWLLVPFLTSNILAQTCSSGLIDIQVTDNKGKGIPDVAIELAAEMPYEKYDKYLQDKETIKIPSGGWKVVKIPAHDAEEIIKRSAPVTSERLIAKQPLKRSAKSPQAGFDLKDEAGLMHFHFISREAPPSPALLLKVSAPGYTDEYYAAPFLYGCWGTYKFILPTKKEGGQSGKSHL